MNSLISPKYQMKLIEKVEKSIWSHFNSYQKVEFYINKWHEIDEDSYNYWENFTIVKKEENKIDILSTLHNIDGELLLKIAVDLGIETPDFIPAIPTFKNLIKEDYPNANSTFEKAFKQIGEHPDIAIGLANSTLESIIKKILQNKQISKNINTQNKTLYDLTQLILKELSLYPNTDMPKEIKNIGSALLSANKSIEKLRSEKTDMHGKIEHDYIIKDKLYTYFIVNSIATIGLFLISYNKTKFSELSEDKSYEESIFSMDKEHIPF